MESEQAESYEPPLEARLRGVDRGVEGHGLHQGRLRRLARFFTEEVDVLVDLMEQRLGVFEEVVKGLLLFALELL